MFGCYKKRFIFASAFRARSSVGSEHLVYTQGVRGSNPFAPTERSSEMKTFFYYLSFYINTKAFMQSNFGMFLDTSL